MSHTNSTANYQLPQFLGTDKPAWLTDVNQAYADIDTAMKANEVSAGQANALATQNASAISTQSGQISTLSTKVTALETAQPVDEAQIETNRQNIATNAQNIVEIDNRLGHTSIATIGDGTVTGAIDDLQGQITAIPTSVDADDVSYDNTTSGLNATNVQDAIDEVNAKIPTSGDSVQVVGDGVKTYSQLLTELYSLVDFSKVNGRTKFLKIDTTQTAVFNCRTFASTYATFFEASNSDTTLAVTFVGLTNPPVFRGAQISNVPAFSVVNAISTVAANGEIFKIVY